MEQDTILGQYFLDTLLSGQDISDKTLVTLLKGAINSPESQHYGYVLDGFPTYISFDEQLELIKNLNMKPDYIIHIEVTKRFHKIMFKNQTGF